MGSSPIKGLIDISDTLVDSENPNKYFYKIVVDDDITENESKGVIKLVRVDPTKADKRYQFDWGDKNGDVLSWSPKFSGTTLIFSKRAEMAKAAAEHPNTITTISSDPQTGEAVATNYQVTEALNSLKNSAQIPWDNEALQSVIVKDINWFNEEKNYNYEGTLEVIGIADGLDICKTVVDIEPMINGQPHHTAGLYVVKGITDQVGSSGFTTTLDVYKYSEAERSAEDGKYYVTKSDGTKVEVFDYIPSKQ